MQSKPLAVLLSIPLLVTTCLGQVGTTTRVSISSSGEQGNGDLADMGMSSDARYVVFRSQSDNLVLGDTNEEDDVFLRDRITGVTTRVSIFNGLQSNGFCARPKVSSAGPKVVFECWDWNNWIPGYFGTVYVHDASTGITSPLAVSSKGQLGNDQSSYCWITANGSYVVFSSAASNLVAGDTNNRTDVFLRDLLQSTTQLVSVGTAGSQQNGWIGLGQTASEDGRFIAFCSDGDNLVPGDNNETYDVYLRDRLLSTTTRISVSSSGVEGNGMSDYPHVSADGRYVAFASDASNFVPEDTNGARDIFVRDTLAGVTTRVSISTFGNQSNGWSFFSSISQDGRFIGFDSEGSNLVPNDGNSASDAFLHDRLTGQTMRVSVSSVGEEGNNHSGLSTTSSDGRIVAFVSHASNLVPGDTNNEEDVFVFDRSTLPPTSFVLQRGVLEQGDIGSFVYSDDIRAIFRPGVVFSTSQPPIALVLESNSSQPAGDELTFSVESSTSSTAITQFIEFYDFISGAYDLLDQRPTSTTDALTVLSVSRDPERFFGPNNILRARVSFKAYGPLFAYPWRARLDRASWTVR